MPYISEGGIEPNDEAVAAIKAFFYRMQHACQIVGQFLSAGVFMRKKVLVASLEHSNGNLIILETVFGNFAALAMEGQCG